MPDCSDGCSEDGKKTEPGKCGCGNLKTNSDGDGTPDCNDECPMDASKITPGKCGCSVPGDCNHSCSQDATKTEPGKCGCSIPDDDTDGDETLDCNDFCHRMPPRLSPANADVAISTPIEMAMAWPIILTTIVHWTQTRWNLESAAAELQTSIPRMMKRWIAKTRACKENPKKTAPSRCGYVAADTDSDGDSVPDVMINMKMTCQTRNWVSVDGTPDMDRDGEGTVDCIDQCKDDKDKVETW